MYLKRYKKKHFFLNSFSSTNDNIVIISPFHQQSTGGYLPIPRYIRQTKHDQPEQDVSHKSLTSYRENTTHFIRDTAVGTSIPRIEIELSFNKPRIIFRAEIKPGDSQEPVW